ncbi:smoothelin-like protein 2 isoform X2 [Drosophila obscura]|uniref:smoothelin-like protein 2 isoform X2 n=1 Tax=Drosophila obscura TaxID=7282 RepID=UPI001BB229EA|nr:smoothelin-like protein 2 isoform X2 [Drosophila obscura]
MEAMEEHLCEIKELVNHLQAASMPSEMCLERNSTLNDSPPMLCMGKLIILIRLMADRFRERCHHCNQVVDISRILAKCTGQIKRLYLTLPCGQLEMQLNKVVKPSFILALSAIFSELEGVVKDHFMSAPIEPKYGEKQKADENNEHSAVRDNLAGTAKKPAFHKLNSDELNLWKPCPTNELGRVTAKLRNFEVKMELEQHAAEMKFKKQQNLVLELSSGLSEEKLKLQAALKENSRLLEIQQKCGQPSCQKQKAAVNKMGNAPPKNLTGTESRPSLINKPTVEEGYSGTTFGQRRQKLLRWCQEKTKPYGLPMYEFSTSWQSGHALCAIIHSYRPKLIDTKYLKFKNRQETLEYGVMVAQSLGARNNNDFVSLCLQKLPENRKVFKFVAELYNCLESLPRFADTTAKSESRIQDY